MRYRLTDLEHFVEAAECTSLSEAAHKLEVSQPALSQSIKRLESDLQIVLFYRSRTGIKLTPDGKALLARAESLLHAMRELPPGGERHPFSGGSKISIGCHALVAQYSLPRALSHLRRVAPDYRVELRHDLSRNIQFQIQRGEIDIGIVINATAVPDLVIRTLGVDDVAVFASRNGRGMDTIVCDLNLFQTQSILKRWKNKPGKIVATSSLELVCRLTAEGIGYGILPSRAVRVTGVPLKRMTALPTVRDEIHLIFRPEFGRSAAEKLVLEALRRSIAS
jgi:DNA-binding transcriptional LysR family regulator